jgi:hypothetical protein
MYRYGGLIMTFILHIFCYFIFCGLELTTEIPEITGFIRGNYWKAQFMYLYFLDEMELNNGYKELKHYRMLLGLQWFS